MADDISESTGAGDEPHESPTHPGRDDAAGTVSELSVMGATTDAADREGPADQATAPPAASQAPVAPASAAPEVTPAGSGQRRITRHTTMTTRTENETTTDEAVVETIAMAPPVYAAPTSEHPRPVG